MTTKQEIYNWGKSHAQGIPENNWTDAIEKAVSKGYTWEDDYDRIEEIYSEFCYDAEENSRQYSPFEFLAEELNELAETKPYDPWEVFDDAITKYIAQYWQENLAEICEYFEELVAERSEDAA